jgi:hypothetical protein
MPRRSASDPGSVFEVTLDDGALAYGIVVEFPLVAFFDLRASDRQSLEDVLSSEVLFRIWIMRSALGKSGWPVIGCASVPSHLTATPTFYKFDSIARKFSVYSNGTETPATREQCLPLECASVWSASHVEARLADHFAGRPNRWVQSLSASSRL